MCRSSSPSFLLGLAVGGRVHLSPFAARPFAASEPHVKRHSCYTLQFGKNPPRFDGVHLTVVNSASKASVLQQELSSLLQKGAIEEVPQSEVERGFFMAYYCQVNPVETGGIFSKLKSVTGLNCAENPQLYPG